MVHRKRGGRERSKMFPLGGSCKGSSGVEDDGKPLKIPAPLRMDV